MSIAIIVIILGATGAMTGGIVLIGKGILGFVIWAGFFARGRRARLEAQVRKLLETLNPTGMADLKHDVTNQTKT